MVYVKKYLSCTGLILLLSGTGCTLGDNCQVTASLPLDGEIFQHITPDSWEITYLGEKETPVTITVPNKPFILKVPKESPLVIRAQVVVSGQRKDFKLRPAGAILPSCTPNMDRVRLNWMDGYTANVLLKLSGAGISLNTINTERLADTVRRRTDSSPWNLDTSLLISDILSGTLWFYSVKRRPGIRFNPGLPAGTWYSSYPPDAPRNAGNTEWFLTEGIHTFLRLEDQAIALVQVEESGISIMVSTLLAE